MENINARAFVEDFKFSYSLRPPRSLRFNRFMSKTRKEIAFLRDLYVADDWTRRFTGVLDENFDFSDEKSILYVNGGTGDHVIELRRKLNENSQLEAFGEDEELNAIAQAKAAIANAKINFSDEFPRRTFNAVLADASFVEPQDLPEFLKEIVDLSDNRVVFFLPTAGSFGEVFSFLWETLLDLDMPESGAEVERLIIELPTVSKVEEMSRNLGLSKLETITKNEFFEFENGAEFINSPLVADFLLPVWLEFLDEAEKEQVREKLARIIDDADGTMTFRFSVKATLIVGEK